MTGKKIVIKYASSKIKGITENLPFCDRFFRMLRFGSEALPIVDAIDRRGALLLSRQRLAPDAGSPTSFAILSMGLSP
jgi:hypothetical protein